MALLCALLCALVFGFVLSGCASSESARASSSQARIRSLDELPPEYKDVWSAWLAKDPTWSERREALVADDALRSFVVENLLRVMLKQFGERKIASLGSPKPGLFERARAELLRFPEDSASRLTTILAVSDGLTGELATQLLEEIGKPAVLPLAALLERDDVRARRRAADLLARLPHAHASEAAVRDALIERLASDSDWLVRAKAAKALGRRGSRDLSTDLIRRSLCRALGDKDRAVGIQAVNALGVLGDPMATPAVINYLERSGREGIVAGLSAAQQTLAALMRDSTRRDIDGWRRFWSDWLDAKGSH